MKKNAKVKTRLKKVIAGIILISGISKVAASTTWSYFITDAGNGNSLVTWTVSGDLTTQTGLTLLQSQSNLNIPISAPEIFNDGFAANGSNQNIPTPDGSLFNLGDVYFPIVSFSANNSSGSANDTFSLLSTPLLPRNAGQHLNYEPATQSVLLPIDYSDFNPGTYQSQITTYSPSFTVNLTVGPVPEPTTLALTVLAGIGLVRGISKRKK